MSAIDIVLDLETMGKGNNAAVIEIGAVAFDHDTLELIPASKGGEFDVLIDLESAIESGGIVDGSTIKWWMQQSDDARGRFNSEHNVPHNAALWRFKNWTERLKNIGTIHGVWGNGAVFDNVILGNAFDRACIVRPWTYREDRCYRTLRAERPDIEADEWVGVYHSGVDDARNEAKHLIKILKEIRA